MLMFQVKVETTNICFKFMDLNINNIGYPFKTRNSMIKRNSIDYLGDIRSNSVDINCQRVHLGYLKRFLHGKFIILLVLFLTGYLLL